MPELFLSLEQPDKLVDKERLGPLVRLGLQGISVPKAKLETKDSLEAKVLWGQLVPMEPRVRQEMLEIQALLEARVSLETKGLLDRTETRVLRATLVRRVLLGLKGKMERWGAQALMAQMVRPVRLGWARISLPWRQRSSK
jgi:hypothetical protein